MTTISLLPNFIVALLPEPVVSFVHSFSAHFGAQAGAYWGVFLTPLAQQDVAVFSAAAAAKSQLGQPMILFACLVIGMVFSDLSKYGAGRLANKVPWAQKLAARSGVDKAKGKVLSQLGLALLVARFVPGTRLPVYLAAGVFRAPLWKVSLYVVLTAIAYGAVVFGLFYLVGAAFAAHARIGLAIMVGLLVLGAIGFGLFQRRQQKLATSNG